MNNTEYLDIIETFQHCQRNWDHSKTIDDETIDFLMEVGYNVPTKQNLYSYKIVCIKDRDEVRKWASIARNSDETVHWTGETIQQEIKDGVLQNPSTTVSTGSANPYTESLTIGSDQASGGNSFLGKIDEFAVYDRELTQAEVTRMFNTYFSANRIANGNFSQIGNEEVTNGDFSQIGSELVTNGDSVSENFIA